MGRRQSSALLSLIGIILLWPCVLTKSFSLGLPAADSTSPLAGAVVGIAEHGEERPRVAKRSTRGCENYCLNNGQCMFLVDFNQNHCRCESGFQGPRCALPQLVTQPMGEEQIIVTVFCVTLLIVGLSGALYFFWKWYKKNRGVPECFKRFTHKATSSTDKARQDALHL